MLTAGIILAAIGVITIFLAVTGEEEGLALGGFLLAVLGLVFIFFGALANVQHDDTAFKQACEVDHHGIAYNNIDNASRVCVVGGTTVPIVYTKASF